MAVSLVFVEASSKEISISSNNFGDTQQSSVTHPEGVTSSLKVK